MSQSSNSSSDRAHQLPVPPLRARLRQVLQALNPARHSGPEHERVVGTYLTPAQVALFNTMDGRDKFHAAQTALNLLTMGVDDQDVLVAGLLHDAAKGRQRLPYRVAYVLLDSLSPRLLQRIAREDGWGPRGAFHRSVHHAAQGAELARAAGASERTCAFIAAHHAGGPGQDLRDLIAADNHA